MVTSHYLMPLIISLSGKGKSSELAAHISLRMEVWVGFEALLRFTSLTDSGEHFQPRLHADILYLLLHKPNTRLNLSRLLKLTAMSIHLLQRVDGMTSDLEEA